MYSWFAQFWYVVEKWRIRALYMDVHDEMYRQGWTNQLSFYGTLKKNGAVVRVEVLSQRPFTVTQIRALRALLEGWEMQYGYVLIALTRDGLKEVVPRGLVN